METYEDDLIEWYWHHQKENLTNWLCIERVLDPGEEGKDGVAHVMTNLTENNVFARNHKQLDFLKLRNLTKNGFFTFQLKNWTVRS